MEDNIKML